MREQRLMPDGIPKEYQTPSSMTRKELKSKQTPGDAICDGGTVYINGASVVFTESPLRDYREEDAMAALYAEAHNVANRTGMWPEDLVARIKELEEALASCEYAMTRNKPQSKTGEQWEWGDVLTHARAILNKKP